VNENINDLLVYVRIPSNKLPIIGFFELDQDDLPMLLTERMLENVVLHEMGHILGCGTLWNYHRQPLVGAGGDDPDFNGMEAHTQLTGTIGFS
jgi:hypothetical protein